MRPCPPRPAATRLARLRGAGPRRRRPQADTLPRQGAGRRPQAAGGARLPFNGYIGASIELKPAGGGPWKAWLLLVETIPAGTEGTPVERNLVRNALQPAWDGSQAAIERRAEAALRVAAR